MTCSACSTEIPARGVKTRFIPSHQYGVDQYGNFTSPGASESCAHSFACQPTDRSHPEPYLRSRRNRAEGQHGSRSRWNGQEPLQQPLTAFGGRRNVAIKSPPCHGQHAAQQLISSLPGRHPKPALQCVQSGAVNSIATLIHQSNGHRR
uniref:Uncharacterized protein n=1 Tax=Anopheles melas TaxID=34690 RepID=A0A182UFQ9_9DIPT